MPDTSDALTPLIETEATPMMSDACTCTTADEFPNSVSVVGLTMATAGGVASRLIVTVLGVVPPSESAVHVSVVSAASVVIHIGSQPDVAKMVDCGSVTDQVTVTSLT